MNTRIAISVIALVMLSGWAQDAEQHNRHNDLYAWIGDMDVAAQIAPGSRVVLSEEAERIHTCNRLLEEHVGTEVSRIYMLLVGGSHDAQSVDMIPSRFLAGIHGSDLEPLRMPNYICGQHRGRLALAYNDGSVPMRWVERD